MVKRPIRVALPAAVSASILVFALRELLRLRREVAEAQDVFFKQSESTISGSSTPLHINGTCLPGYRGRLTLDPESGEWQVAQCPMHAHDSPACACLPGYEGRLLFDKGAQRWRGACSLVECPIGASGAPTCRCHWAMDGDLSFDMLSQRWIGSCSPPPMDAEDATARMGENHQVPRVLVGVLTYNRGEYVQLQAASLRSTLANVPWGRGVHLWVYDDGSNEYGEQELRDWFPMAEKVVISQQNLGGFGAINTIRMLTDAARNEDYDVIVTSDSDLVFHPQFYSRLIKALPLARSGVISLYNSCYHKIVYCQAGLCMRNDIGSAGLAFKRSTLLDVLSNVVLDRLFDWRVSKYITETKGQLLYSLSPSMVEHLGAVGANGRASVSDRAIDFPLNELDNSLREKVSEIMIGRPPCDLIRLAGMPWSESEPGKTQLTGIKPRY